MRDQMASIQKSIESFACQHRVRAFAVWIVKGGVSLHGYVKVEVHEVEGMQLLARTGSGFAFVMDSPKDNGGLEQGQDLKKCY